LRDVCLVVSVAGIGTWLGDVCLVVSAAAGMGDQVEICMFICLGSWGWTWFRDVCLVVSEAAGMGTRLGDACLVVSAAGMGPGLEMYV